MVCLSKLEQNPQKIYEGEKTVKLLDVYSQGTDSLGVEGKEGGTSLTASPFAYSCAFKQSVALSLY